MKIENIKILANVEKRNFWKELLHTEYISTNNRNKRA